METSCSWRASGVPHSTVTRKLSMPQTLPIDHKWLCCEAVLVAPLDHFDPAQGTPWQSAPGQHLDPVWPAQACSPGGVCPRIDPDRPVGVRLARFDLSTRSASDATAGDALRSGR